MLGGKVTYLASPSEHRIEYQDHAYDSQGTWFDEGVSIPMFQYPAIFDPDPDDGSFTVTFPDFGYGVTQGSTRAEAEEMGADLLACLMTDCMEKRTDFSKPGRLRGRKIRPITLPALLDAKANLYVAMRTAGMRKADLARRLGCQKSQVDRLLDFKNSTRMGQIEAAFHALGKRIVIEVQNAA